MKKANDDVFSCQEFQENISRYIDSEMTESVVKRFLGHAEICPKCGKILTRMMSVRKTMRALPEIEVSREFDFRLKSMVRFENRRLEDPLYRMKLYFRENAKYLATLPVAAMILFGFMYMNSDPLQPEQIMPEVTMTEQYQDIEPDDSHEEIVRYVLDSVDRGDASEGIFLNERDVMQQASLEKVNIKSISY